MADYQHPLLDKQKELEGEMIANGREIFAQQMREIKERGLESTTTHGQQLLKKCILPLAEAVEKRDGIRNSKQSNEVFSYINQLPPEVVAFITFRTILDGISKERPLVAMAIDLGRRIEDEIHFKKFKMEQRELFGITKDKIDKGKYHGSRRVLLGHMADRHNIHWSEWPNQLKLRIGIMLIRMTKASTGTITWKRITRGQDDMAYFVIPTPETLKFMQVSEDRLGLLSTSYWPMICPPKRWTNPYNGGYWTSEARTFPMVKVRSRRYLEELAGVDMPGVYQSVNAMQETAWKVNDKILETLKTSLERGLAIGKVPPTEDIPIPVKPENIEESADAKREWKKQAAKIHQANMALQSKRFQVLRTVRIADKYAPYEAVYFPYTLDFRGRAYTVPAYLTPQGSDYQKALLRFSKGKPIENEGQACWLAVHGSNLYGFDKVDLQSRVDWVGDHEAQIFSAAYDPFGAAFTFWTSAGDPWQFLAFCFEWAAMVDAGVIGYVTTLPIQLDGTCNGLQHFSAALRDPVGAKAVNLIPAEQPQDIYGEVAKLTMDKLKKLIQSGTLDAVSQPIAEKLHSIGINRKVTKRVVMCLPYGLSKFSAREYVEEGVRELIGAANPSPFAYIKHTIDDKYVPLHGFWEASYILTPLIWESIEETVKGARKIMDWLQRCARVAASEGMPVNWATPDGFYVEQRYPKFRVKKIDTVLEGRVQLLYREEEPDVDKRAMSNAIAPNWVHSMDGCALRMYVCMAQKRGIKHFSMVHDSYGTLATDVELMRNCLKEAFVKMYRENEVLNMFHTEIANVVSMGKLGELPTIPAKGDLNLDVVLQSEFFFA